MSDSSREDRLSEQYANRSWSDSFSPNHEFSYSSGASCLFHFLLILILGLWLTDPTNKDLGAVEVELISIAPEPNLGDGVDAGGGEPPLEEAQEEEVEKAETAEVVENPDIDVEEKVEIEISGPSVPPPKERDSATKTGEALAKLRGTGGEETGEAGGGGGGSVDDLIGALKAAGAGTGDISFSLKWNDVNDIDLHVTTPSGQTIYYKNPNSADGGILDLDANANGLRSNPIAENIFWPEGKAPEGVYKVSVNYYAYQGGPTTTHFNVLIQQNGKEPKVFSKSITPQDGTLQIATIRFERD